MKMFPSGSDQGCVLDNEDARLSSLHSYDVLDTPPEESFDRITRLAKLSLQVPIAYVAFIDRERQWLKSFLGAIQQETPRNASFCTHAIASHGPMMVPDATQDERFRDSPMVRQEPFIRFYLGIPLRTPEGFNIGTLCVADTKPRHASPAEVEVLQDLARLVVDELQLRKIAATDSLTGLLTRRSFMAEGARLVEQAKKLGASLSAIMLDIDHFKSINDRHGHGAGDDVIKAVANACAQELRESDLLGRLGGEEFSILLPACRIEVASSIAERVRLRVLEGTGDFPAGVTVGISAGVAELAVDEDVLGQLLERADAALYSAKNSGRNRVVINRGDEMHPASAAA